MGIKKQTVFILVLSLVLIAAIIASVSYGMKTAAAQNEAEATRTLEDSIKRAAISCYAIEGCYPPTLDYLRENYGVYIDDEKYMVYYDVFASNLMPDITVLER
jgi:uncharacterized protein (DUF4213/DUF364 family)